MRRSILNDQSRCMRSKYFQAWDLTNSSQQREASIKKMFIYKWFKMSKIEVFGIALHCTARNEKGEQIRKRRRNTTLLDDSKDDWLAGNIFPLQFYIHMTCDSDLEKRTWNWLQCMLWFSSKCYRFCALIFFILLLIDHTSTAAYSFVLVHFKYCASTSNYPLQIVENSFVRKLTLKRERVIGWTDRI